MSEQIAASYEILTNATTTATGSSIELGASNKTVQAKGTTSAGAGAATIVIEVTNNTDWPWITAGTITLVLGTSATADGFAISAGWKAMRARVSAISGTDAAVSVNVGV